MSQQGVLSDLFVVPVADLPAVPDPPIAPSASPIAKHCSSMGALVVQPGRENLWRRMLAKYRIAPRTDAEMAEWLGVQRSTINARRAELIAMGLVEDMKRTRKNPVTGVSNTLWGLTEKGRNQ